MRKLLISGPNGSPKASSNNIFHCPDEFCPVNRRAAAYDSCFGRNSHFLDHPRSAEPRTFDDLEHIKPHLVPRKWQTPAVVAFIPQVARYMEA